MKVGIVKEIKNNENRVAIIPASVKEFLRYGHEVYIECGAGVGSGFRDEEYAAAGAIMVEKAEDVWNTVDLLYKVKEILPSEYKKTRIPFSLKNTTGLNSLIIYPPKSNKHRILSLSAFSMHSACLVYGNRFLSCDTGAFCF